MAEKLYGGKCHRCACLRHDGEQSEPTIGWLRMEPLECAGCPSCQSAAFARHMDDLGFGPDALAAVRAFRRGEPHPLIDRLRDEIQAEGEPQTEIASAMIDRGDFDE